MHQITNSIPDDETSKLDCFSNLYFKISDNLSEFLPTENPKQLENKSQEKLFSKEFINIFCKKERLKSIEENKYNKIYSHILSSKRDKYFPFTEGEGIKTCMEKLGYNVRFITPNKINIIDPKNPSKKRLGKRFRIYDCSENKKGILKKIKYKKRRYISDDIRKKIKVKFHKNIKNIINLNLKSAGSLKYFEFFPQNFITNITIKLNKIALNYTFEELIKTNIASDILKLKTTRLDIVKQRANLDVLNYLDRNPTISKLSSFNIIKKMKYKKLLKAYFISKEFENSIIELHQKNERDEYIEIYINEALRYVQFFENNEINPKNKKKGNNNIIEIIYDEEDDEDNECNDDE